MGDCIIENGEVTVGVTLMVGITRTGAGLLADAAAAAAPAPRLLLRPAAPAALILGPSIPPTTGPEMILLELKLPIPRGDAMGTAPVLVWAVAVVTTGLEYNGCCETAKSEPDWAVTSEDVADVR